MKHLLPPALCLALLCALTIPAAPAPGQEVKASAGYKDVAPILQSRCITCHAGARPPAGLRLDSYADILKGSRDGAVVVPGKPDQSPMIKAVRGITKPRMPKNGPPWLSDDQVSLLERWIASGAKE